MMDLRNDRGIALVVALMAMLVMMALGTALLLAGAAESRIVRNFRNITEARYVADAALERSIGDLAAVADWSLLLTGEARTSFVDGEPRGVRTIGDGRAINLDEVLNNANCQRPGGCSQASMSAITAERPWGPNNPRWQPIAWGHVDNLISTAMVRSPFYVLVFAADDPSDCDDDPAVDGGAIGSCPSSTKTNPGAGVITLRAEAFGPFGTHKVTEVTVARWRQEESGDSTGAGVADDNSTVSYYSGTGQAGIRIMSWRDVRQP